MILNQNHGPILQDDGYIAIPILPDAATYRRQNDLYIVPQDGQFTLACMGNSRLI